jgi:hypothetical protein
LKMLMVSMKWCWCFLPSSSPFPIFLPFLSLYSSRVHPYSWGVEREWGSSKWMGEWVRGWASADKDPNLCWHVGLGS